MSTAIIVHGGAGAWDLDTPRIVEAVKACRQSALLGQSILLDGGSALDAVEAAVRVLEDCPVLDAGRGSYLNAAGVVEMDALIMDGRTLGLGAVGAVQRVANPISLARRVMTDSEHALLVGDGAGLFADRIGFPRCSAESLIVDHEAYLHELLHSDDDYRTVDIFTKPNSMDTVGAVARDRDGNVAAATSTGGTRRKLPGRVGDSPLVGSGGYADNRSGAVSATGHGEALMKVVISKTICDWLEAGVGIDEACRLAIARLAERVDGKGGVIAVNRHGRLGLHFNTTAMPHAFAAGDEPVTAGR